MPHDIDTRSEYLVRRSDAEALIAARNAEIAELRARLETVERETREVCIASVERRLLQTMQYASEAEYKRITRAVFSAIRRAGEKE